MYNCLEGVQHFILAQFTTRFLQARVRCLSENSFVELLKIKLVALGTGEKSEQLGSKTVYSGYIHTLTDLFASCFLCLLMQRETETEREEKRDLNDSAAIFGCHSGPALHISFK